MNTLNASFAMGNRAKMLQERFVQQLGPAVAHVCKGRATPQQMEECVREAALNSGWGRFVLAHNYWMLPGRGDRGSFLIVRVARDPSSVSGMRPLVEKYAKFSTLEKAIDAWCRSKVKR